MLIRGNIRQQCMEFRVYTRGIGLMAVLPNIQAVSDFADLSGSRWTQKIEACERGRGSGPTGPLVRAAIPGAPGLPAAGPLRIMLACEFLININTGR